MLTGTQVRNRALEKNQSTLGKKTKFTDPNGVQKRAIE